MYQTKYALEIISEIRYRAAKPTPTPINSTTKLTTTEYDHHLKEIIDYSDEVLTNQGVYQRRMGNFYI